MWERLRRRFVRRQRNSEVKPQTTVPSAQSPTLSEPSNPAPPLAADNSPGAATDDNAAGQQVLDLEVARAAAHEIVASAYLLAQLSPTEQESVRGLLADDPTPEQIEQGKAALVALQAALVAQSDLEERRGNVLKKMLPAILRAWYNTPSWPASRRWLKDLLIEIPPDGPALLEAAANYLRSASKDDDGARSLAQHAALLREARRVGVGVDAAYHAIIGDDAFPQPDDSDPSPERQVELREKYKENVKVGKPPYAGVVIRTRGEVKWIVREREWRTETTGDIETSEQVIDLRDVGIEGAVLGGVDLSGADLSGAYIRGSYFDTDADAHASLRRAKLTDAQIHDTDFSGADWTFANLSGIWMTGCTLTDANFALSNLSGAIILNCTFTRTKLPFANLSGAGISGKKWVHFRDVNLEAANLSGTELLIGFKDSDVGSDLTQARMDSATLLGDSGYDDDDHNNEESQRFQFDERTCLLDVGWNGAVLANVWWGEPPHRLRGDEATIKEATSRKTRVNARRNAARAYRGLAKALQAQGLTSPALSYRAREQQLERRALLFSFNFGPWLFYCLLNIVSGYGDRPWRSLFSYVGVVSAFAASYWAFTNHVFGFITSNSAHLTGVQAVVLSISSFHGRGFFPYMLNLGDPVAVVAALEAIIGLFIELVFVATFTQRFFAR